MENLLLSIGIIFAIQIVFFIFAAAFKTDKVTDLAYGLTFVILSWFLMFKEQAFFPEQILLVILVTLWGVRLSGYLFVRILKTKKDDRFDNIRDSFLKFGSFWLFQTILISIIMLPIIFFLGDTSKQSMFTIIGLTLWITGFIIESLADYQKYKFRSNPANKDKWVNIGLWHYSRHPNYFGEILCWIGIFLFAVPTLEGWELLAVLSPISITISIVFFSGIPILEKLDHRRYGENPLYGKYLRDTPILIPGFHKKRKI